MPPPAPRTLFMAVKLSALFLSVSFAVCGWSLTVSVLNLFTEHLWCVLIIVSKPEVWGERPFSKGLQWASVDETVIQQAMSDEMLQDHWFCEIYRVELS